MIRKRLIGVVTVKNGWGVQSFGYQRWLPLGRPEVLVENLDRWGADEILLQCVDRSGPDLGPDFALLDRVARKGLSTPLIYGGGVRSVEQAVAAIKSGADRVCVDAVLHDSPQVLAEMAAPLGAQALIAALPLAIASQGLSWLDHRTGKEGSLTRDLLQTLRSGAVSEALVIDWRHEGQPRGFDPRLLGEFPVEGMPLVAFGGLSEAQQIREVLESDRVAAIAIGNFLNYRELAVHQYKTLLPGLPLRPSPQ